MNCTITAKTLTAAQLSHLRRMTATLAGSGALEDWLEKEVAAEVREAWRAHIRAEAQVLVDERPRRDRRWYWTRPNGGEVAMAVIVSEGG